jgi:acyl transferase domain-containing protein
VFTAVLDEFFDAMGQAGEKLRQDWLAPDPSVPLDDASRAQPLLFVIDYALGRSLMSRSLRPAVLLGHSVGELAAAALAGVFSLADAARLLSARIAATADARPGGMLAVSAAVADLADYLDESDDPDGVVVGARNAPRQTVLAGPEPRLSAVARALADAGISCRPVRARQPFHSPAMSGPARLLEQAIRGCTLRPPLIPIMSTRTAELLRPEQALDPSFWAGQLAEPVLFWPALEGLLAGGAFTLVESGPGQGLSMLARRHPAVRSGDSAVIPLLSTGREHAMRVWTEAIAKLTETVTTVAECGLIQSTM